MKALLYAVNAVQQTVAEDGTIVFDTVVRQDGNTVKLSGGNVVTTEAGYYRVDVNVTVISTAAEILNMKVLVNGVAVPGATASFTSTAIGQYGSLTIPCIVRTYGCCKAAPTVISVELDNAATVTNAAIEVTH